MSQAEADKKLRRAQSQLSRVQTAIWEPEDREEAVTWAFYAYENGVVAVAEKANMKWKKTHWDKLDIADQIRSNGYVPVNVRDRLDELNELRKDVQYDEPGPDLAALDLEDLATELEEFLGYVETFVKS